MVSPIDNIISEMVEKYLGLKNYKIKIILHKDVSEHFK
jgi:hypothetical protein